MDGDWRDGAACKGMHTDAFYTEHRLSQDVIKTEICADCPVKAECLDTAMRMGDRYGIWGGTNPTDRRRLGMLPRIGERDWVVELRNHGTPAGLRQHQRKKTRPCQPCRDAEQARRNGLAKA